MKGNSRYTAPAGVPITGLCAVISIKVTLLLRWISRKNNDAVHHLRLCESRTHNVAGRRIRLSKELIALMVM